VGLGWGAGVRVGAGVGIRVRAGRRTAFFVRGLPEVLEFLLTQSHARRGSSSTAGRPRGGERIVVQACELRGDWVGGVCGVCGVSGVRRASGVSVTEYGMHGKGFRLLFVL